VSYSPKVNWNINHKGVNRLMRKHADESVRNVADAVTDASRAGAEAVKNEAILKGSPTGSDWHKIVNQQRQNDTGARVDSGNMLSSVNSETAQQVAFGVIQGSYGLPLNGPEYFMEQEEGTYEPDYGVKGPTPAMNSYQKSKEQMLARLKHEMARYGFQVQ